LKADDACDEEVLSERQNSDDDSGYVSSLFSKKLTTSPFSQNPKTRMENTQPFAKKKKKAPQDPSQDTSFRKLAEEEESEEFNEGRIHPLNIE
jgi:hypothetical protein